MALACALTASCKRPSGPAQPVTNAPASPSASVLAVEPQPPVSSADPQTSTATSEAADADADVPTGYELTRVWQIVASEDGATVLLVDESETTVLPIFVGGTEALTIQLRLDGRHYPRPLTHDLLSALVADLGGRPVRAQVDELRGETFYGTVFVLQGDHLFKLDARPSDAIAMALGSGVPLFVSRSVMLSSGWRREDVDRALDDRKLEKPRHLDPISL
jgi:bifunctional DNase/RNase